MVYVQISAPLKYRIRQAKQEDIPLIDQCNRKNLPENYSYDFFSKHLVQWPELSIIAETVSGTAELVGYALGRVEMYPENKASQNRYEAPSYYGHVASVAVHDEFRGQGVATALVQELHRQFALQYELDTSSLFCRVSTVQISPVVMPLVHSYTACGQVSNKAAIKLYSKVLKYQCDHIDVKYYENLEDACFMVLHGLQRKYMPSVQISVEDRAGLRAE